MGSKGLVVVVVIVGVGWDGSPVLGVVVVVGMGHPWVVIRGRSEIRRRVVRRVWMMIVSRSCDWVWDAGLERCSEGFASAHIKV